LTTEGPPGRCRTPRGPLETSLRGSFAVRAAALVVGLLLAGAVRAADYDPQLRWRTITTEHFRVHFHQGEERLADEFSAMVERVYADMSAEMRWRLREKTEVVLIDRTDQANGFATAVPYNSITIYVTAPTEDSTLSLYEDWNEAIFTHELTHVLHMETNGGVVAAARAVVGRIATTNAVSPGWIVEGLATFQETRHTDAGRGRSGYVDMLKRTAVLEHTFPPLGNLEGYQARLPSGNLRYLWGQDLLQFVADTRGEDVWTRWSHAYGRDVPWALFLIPPKRVFGARIQRLYREWREHETLQYEAQATAIASEGIREGRLLSNDRSSCGAPSFSPAGNALVWTCWDPRTGNALWLADGRGEHPRKLKQDIGAKTFTWRRDGKAFVYAATHLVNRFNFWSDIYLFDLGTKKIKALTTGARARDPDFSPDGQQLVMVTNRVQETRLSFLTVDQQIDHRTPGDEQVQYATPRFAPDNRSIAVSIWDRGRRDLWLVAPDGHRLRRLTADAAVDRDPWWSPDGRWLYFSSDRSGVPNVYAIDTATEHLWQVTNVLTGAAKPSVSPDGKLLAYEQYSAEGWEVRLLDLDPATWLDRGTLAASLTGEPPLAALVSPVDRPCPPSAAAASWGEGDPVGGLADDAVADPFLPAEDALDPAAGAREGGAAAGGRSGRVARQSQGEVVGTYEQARVKDAFGEEQAYPFRIPPKRYSPLHALVPRYWIPTIGTTQRLPGPPQTRASAFFDDLPVNFQIGGIQATASTGATDPLRRYSYALWASYRTDANQGGGGGRFVINRWLPVISFGASSDVLPYTYLVAGPWQATGEDGKPEFDSDDVRTVFMRTADAFLNVTYPITVRHGIFAGYAFTWRRLATDLDPSAYLPSVAMRGTIGRLSLGYTYTWGQPTALAVSPEDARNVAVTASVTAPWLGTFADAGDGTRTPLTQVLLTADWREFVVNPWVPNHVLALRGGAGAAFGGADQYLGNFQLGGNGVGAARAIRGYPFGADRGNSYWLLGAEYRAPLWRIDRGIGGTVPLYFRYLALSGFVEAGNAFDEVTKFTDVFHGTLVGAGAELRLAALAGWGGGVELRLGWAVGLTPGGYGIRDPRSFYVLLNTGF
jgi:hypothetical protein